MKLNKTFIAATCLGLFTTSLSLAAKPQIDSIADQKAEQGSGFAVKPQLTNGANDQTNWSIAFAPDGVKVTPGSGEVVWDIPADLPSESFYIGLRASNKDGNTIDTFIVHVGVPQVVAVGPGESAANLSDALRKSHPAGTTFVVKDGEYTSDDYLVGLTNGGRQQMPPTGNANAYSTIMAANPGDVTLSGEAGVNIRGDVGSPSYLAIKGFFINKTYLTATGQPCKGDTSCYPHHIKFTHNGAHTSPGRSVGTSFSRNILFENNYFFGGSRVKLSAYRADKIIARRNIFRFDYSADSPGPQNTLSFYSTTNSFAQNNIAVDSDSIEFWQGGQDSGEFGCPVTSGDAEIDFDRNIQLNSAKAWGLLDSGSSGNCVATLTDNVSWDVRPTIRHLQPQGAVLIDHMTLGDTVIGDNSDYLINGFPGNTRGLTNSIIHNANTKNLFFDFKRGQTDSILGQTFNRVGVNHVNISQSQGSRNKDNNDLANISDDDPIYTTDNTSGGLKYIVRAEPNSNLSGKANDGKALGAQIMTMKGRSGTVFGDSGYNSETETRAWPFPMQEIMQDKMAAMRYTGPTFSGPREQRTKDGSASLSGNRGFARSGTDLTHYIWGYLDNPVPPMNVTAQAADDKKVIIRWDPLADNYKSGITGHRVYDFSEQSGKLSNPRNFSSDAVQAVLDNPKGNSFVVTRLTSNRGESGYSYPATTQDPGDIPASNTAVKTDIPTPSLRVIEVIRDEAPAAGEESTE